MTESSNDITFSSEVGAVTPEQLDGFFVGWEKRPTAETLLKILHASDHIAIALQGEQVIGFATGNTDGVISAYIPLVEVLPEFQGKGIGDTLMKILLKNFEDIYMVDLMCDEDVEGFYKQLGFHKTSAMMLRHYDKQMGEG